MVPSNCWWIESNWTEKIKCRGIESLSLQQFSSYKEVSYWQYRANVYAVVCPLSPLPPPDSNCYKSICQSYMRTFGAPIASILFNCILLEKSNGAPTEVLAKDLFYIFKKAFSEVADDVQITEAEVTLCVQHKTIRRNLHFQCHSIFGNSSSISVDTCSLVAKCFPIFGISFTHFVGRVVSYILLPSKWVFTIYTQR